MRPSRWLRACRRKSSSSPGSFASAHFGSAAGALLSSIRSPRCRVHRADASLRRAVRLEPAHRRVPRRAGTARLPAWSPDGRVYFAGTLYWIRNTVETFGGLPLAVAIPVAGLLVFYMSLYVGVRVGRDGRHGPGVWRARTPACGGRVGRDRIRARAHLRRLPVDPARQRRRDAAADCAAGQHRRGLRIVVAPRDHQRLLRDRRRLDRPAPRRGRGRSPGARDRDLAVGIGAAQ